MNRAQVDEQSVTEFIAKSPESNTEPEERIEEIENKFPVESKPEQSDDEEDEQVDKILDECGAPKTAKNRRLVNQDVYEQLATGGSRGENTLCNAKEKLSENLARLVLHSRLNKTNLYQQLKQVSFKDLKEYFLFHMYYQHDQTTRLRLHDTPWYDAVYTTDDVRTVFTQGLGRVRIWKLPHESSTIP